MQTPADASRPSLRAATDPRAYGGEFYGPSHRLEINGPPVAVRPSRRALDEREQQRLWEVSVEHTGVEYPLPNPDRPGPEPALAGICVQGERHTPMRMMEAWTASATQPRWWRARSRIPTSSWGCSGVQLAATPAGLEDWLHPSADNVPNEPTPTDLIDEAIDTALRSIQQLMIDQGAQLDACGAGTVGGRRRAGAACRRSGHVAVAERVVATNPFRGDGFFTGKAWLTHRLQLSKREAFHRCQMARMHPRLRHVVRGIHRGVRSASSRPR